MKEEQNISIDENNKDSLENLDKQFKKRLDKMFEGLNDVSNLADALATYDKNQLDVIRRNLNIPGLSSANKPKLVAALEENIKDLLSVIFKRFTQTEYGIVKSLVKNKGKLAFKEELSDILLYLRSFGIIGCYINESSEKYIFIPDDLLGLTKKAFDDTSISAVVEKNEKVKKLVKGYLYYYGAVESLELYDLINKHLKGNILDIPTATNLFFDIASKNLGICYDNNYWYLCSEISYEEVIREQKKRETLKPIELTESQVIKAAEDNYTNLNEYDKKLIDYLIINLHIPKSEAQVYVSDMKHEFKIGLSFEEVIKDMPSVLKIQNTEQHDHIVKLLTDIYENTNQWFLKGNTPSQISSMEKPNNESSSSTIVQAKSVKVGRNDPCPCGSGKKYKHCCLV